MTDKPDQSHRIMEAARQRECYESEGRWDGMRKKVAAQKAAPDPAPSE